jgi:DNA-binding transcriptional ArsR family regulator
MSQILVMFLLLKSVINLAIIIFRILNMISKNTHSDPFEQEAALHKLLSHPARLAILDALRHGEECVCHLEALLGYRQSYLSQQLALLREGGLITDRREGWNIYYQVTMPEVFIILDSARKSLNPGASSSPVRQSSLDCPCPKCQSATGK